MNNAELEQSPYVTNSTFLGWTTNVTKGFYTNISSDVVHLAKGAKITNHSKTITERITNNAIYNVGVSTLTNPARLTAKQIRADFVEVIIYSK